MSRRLLLLCALASCRWHFDEQAARDADPSDVPVDIASDAAPVQALCNTPVLIAADPPMVMPRVGAAATTQGIVAGWVRDDGSLDGVRADISGTVVTAFDASAAFSDSRWGSVSIASNGPTVLGVVGIQNITMGLSQVRTFSADLTATNPAKTLDPRIVSSRASISTGLASRPYVVVGRSPSADATVVQSLESTGFSTDPAVPFSAGGETIELGRLAAGYAITIGRNTGACELYHLAPSLLAVSPVTSWGGTACTHPTLAQIAGRTDFLLVRHDGTDNDLNHVIATNTGATFSIPAEGRLSTLSSLPRAVAASDRYWVAFQQNGMLEVIEVSIAGAPGVVHILGPISASLAHELVVFNNEPYAVWFQSAAPSGVYVARMCP